MQINQYSLTKQAKDYFLLSTNQNHAGTPKKLMTFLVVAKTT